MSSHTCAPTSSLILALAWYRWNFQLTHGYFNKFIEVYIMTTISIPLNPYFSVHNFQFMLTSNPCPFYNNHGRSHVLRHAFMILWFINMLIMHVCFPFFKLCLRTCKFICQSMLYFHQFFIHIFCLQFLSMHVYISSMKTCLFLLT